ncbi:MAG: PEP/pyruvate-binding domain-containing protein [Candidatus Dojkabacteria bacterium]
MLGKTTPYILNLGNVKDKDFELVGKEALLHSYVYLANVPTPPSFVITTIAFDDFLTAADLIQPLSLALKKVRPFIRETAVEASEQITNLMLSAKLPSIIERPIVEAYRNLNVVHEMPFVKIQPSHILNTKFLPEEITDDNQLEKNISGIDGLIYQIKMAWLTLFTPEAIEQRANSYYSGPLSMGVLVKRSVASEISGKAYSIPPETLEKNLVEVRSIYGLKDVKMDFDTYCDKYKIDLVNKKIVEKFIVPQSEMYVRKGKIGHKDEPNFKVSISEAWQKKQKIMDERAIQVGLITEHLASIYEQPVEISWSIESGDVYVVEVKLMDLNKLMATSLKNESEKISHSLGVEEVHTNKDKPKISIPNLVKEVQAMVSANDEEEIDEAPQYDDETKKKHLTLADIRKRSIQLDATPKWTDKYDLKTAIYLDLSKVTSARISAAHNFNGTFFDATEMVLTNNMLAEEHIDNPVKLGELADKYALDISVASKVSEHKPFIYSFSNINDYEKKLLGVENKFKFSGDERFIDNPESLITEAIAIKKSKNFFGSKNISVSVPAVRNAKNFESLKKILSTQGIKKGNGYSIYAEISYPSFIFDLENLQKTDLDGLIVDITSLLKMSLQRNELFEYDYSLILPQLELINKTAKGKTFDIVIKIDYLPENIWPKVLDLRPRGVIFETIPEESVVARMQKLESSS